MRVIPRYGQFCRVLFAFIYTKSHLHELSDYDKRMIFALSFLAIMEIGNGFSWHILWGDESHFHLNVSLNTQNSRIRASQQLHNVHEILLHSPNVTVCCGFTGKFMIQSFLIEVVVPTRPETCIVNSQRYHEMLDTFVISQLHQRNCLHPITFMQDGAP